MKVLTEGAVRNRQDVRRGKSVVGVASVPLRLWQENLSWTLEIRLEVVEIRVDDWMVGYESPLEQNFTILSDREGCWSSRRDKGLWECDVVEESLQILPPK